MVTQDFISIKRGFHIHRLLNSFGKLLPRTRKHSPLSLLKKTSTCNEPTPRCTLITKSTITLWTQNQAPSHPKLNTLHHLHPSDKITDLTWQVKFGNFESTMEILDNEEPQSSLNISRVMVKARESLIQTYRVAQNYKGKWWPSDGNVILPTW